MGGGDFYCSVIFTCENNEAMYGRSRVNEKVEPRSSFTFTRGLPYIGANLFANVNFTRVAARKNYATVEIRP